MSVLISTFRGIFGGGQHTSAKDRSGPRRSLSVGNGIQSNTPAVQKPRRGQTLPPPTQNRQQQTSPMPRSSSIPHNVEVQKPAVHQGTYSTVYKGRNGNKLLAIRATRAVRVVEATRKELERERAVWLTLNHENVQYLVGVITRPDLSAYDCTVTLWCPNGSLSDFMKRERRSAQLRIKLIQNIAQGINYLHSFSPPIVHGDLKPSNVLIDSNERAIVCDFGIAQSVRDELSRDMTTTVSKVNSIRYIAPELVKETNSQNPTTQSDIWSLACIIYEVIYSQVPYAHIQAKGNTSQLALFTEVSNGRPPAKRPSNISKEMAQLWKSVLEPSWNSRSSKRPTAAFICQYLEQHATALSAVLP